MSHSILSRRRGCASAGRPASSKSLPEISCRPSMNRDMESYPIQERSLGAAFPRRPASFATADIQEPDQFPVEYQNPDNDHRHLRLGSTCADLAHCGLAALARVWLKVPV